MPNALTPLGAFQTIWAASTDLAALVPTGLWSCEVPEEKVLPLVALLHEGEKPDPVPATSEVVYLEETNLCFEIYASFDPTAPAQTPAAPVATVEKIGLAIKKAFDRTALVIDGARHVATWRARYKPAVVSVEAKKGPTGERVARMSLCYSVWLQREYPR